MILFLIFTTNLKFLCEHSQAVMYVTSGKLSSFILIHPSFFFLPPVLLIFMGLCIFLARFFEILADGRVKGWSLSDASERRCYFVLTC